MARHVSAALALLALSPVPVGATEERQLVRMFVEVSRAYHPCGREGYVVDERGAGDYLAMRIGPKASKLVPELSDAAINEEMRHYGANSP